MITFRQKGDFSHLTKFLERAKEVVRSVISISTVALEWPPLRLRHLSTPD